MLLAEFVMFAAALTPQASYAAGTAPAVLAVASVDEVINNIRLRLMGIVGGWAALCLTVAFMRYSTGEPGRSDAASSPFVAPYSA